MQKKRENGELTYKKDDYEEKETDESSKLEILGLLAFSHLCGKCLLV